VFGTICCPEGTLLPVPEGRSDRSLARPAPPQKSRPVGHGLIGAGMRTDSMIGVISLPEKNMAHLSTRNTSGRGSAPDHTVPYGTVLWGWGCSRHFVPGNDRTVPPGLSPFLRALNLPNISYLRAIQPWAKPGVLTSSIVLVLVLVLVIDSLDRWQVRSPPMGPAALVARSRILESPN
jgi:hypothetical protein